MTREEAVKWLSNLKNDLGQMQYQPLWHYIEATDGIIETLQTPPISQRSMYQAGYRQAQEDRPRGEWVNKEGVYGVAYCSECNYELRVNNTNFCPNCGADMRGDNDYERAIEQMEHDTLYESAYNPEDGSM